MSDHDGIQMMYSRHCRGIARDMLAEWLLNGCGIVAECLLNDDGEK